jgi:uncharacterized protein
LYEAPGKSGDIEMPPDVFQAIDQHDVARLSLLLSQGADPNQILNEPPFWQPLEAAIEEIEHGAPMDVVLSMIKLLIRYGADVNAWDRDRELTPLLKALYFPIVNSQEQRPTDIVRLLLESGADPNVESGEGLTPLKWAVARSDSGLVTDMLQRGAGRTINKAGGSCGCTPLQFAADKLDLPIMRLLLKAGADPDAPDIDGRKARQHLPARNPSNQRAWDEAYELLVKNRVGAPR